MKQSQMNRRDFVERLLVLPVGVFLLRCSSSGTSTYSTTNTGGGGDAPGAPARLSGSEVIYTSSNVQAHTHTFGIELEDFTEPPANGVDGETSNDQAHTHAVSVSAAELSQVESGDSLKVTTSLNSGHTHVFTFVRIG